MAAPTIVSVSPPAEATGVLLSEPVVVLFDQEMDTDYLENQGGFILHTEAYRVVRNAGPIPLDYEQYLEPNILGTTGFRGIIDGAYSFKRINLTDTDEYTGVDDTDADGGLWRTQLTFTPSVALESNRSYAVIVASENTSRTVFDIETTYVGAGDGSISVTGPFVGEAADTFTVTITTTGTRRTAGYTITRASDGYVTSELTATRFAVNVINENNGLKMHFARGSYEAGDTFVFKVKPGTEIGSLYGWSFRSGLVDAEVPETTVDSISGAEVEGVVISGVSSGTSTFSISSITPEHGASNQSLNTSQVIFRFNDEIDSSTVVAGDTVICEGVSVDNIWNHNDSPDYEAMGDIEISTEVVGNLLIVTLMSGDSVVSLEYNNEIRIYLSSDIKSTAGIALDDYLYYFTTRYNPIYCDISQVLAEIGSYLGPSFPEDILYRLLLRYSKITDVLLGSLTVTDTAKWQMLRSEWILCHVVRDALTNLDYLAGSDGARKRLGDLSISYPKTTTALANALNKARECINKIEQQMRVATVKTVAIAVKGSWDPEDPHFGRGIGRYRYPNVPFVNQEYTSIINETYLSSWRYGRITLGN